MSDNDVHDGIPIKLVPITPHFDKIDSSEKEEMLDTFSEKSTELPPHQSQHLPDNTYFMDIVSITDKHLPIILQWIRDLLDDIYLLIIVPGALLFCFNNNTIFNNICTITKAMLHVLIPHR